MSRSWEEMGLVKDCFPLRPLLGEWDIYNVKTERRMQSPTEFLLVCCKAAGCVLTLWVGLPLSSFHLFRVEMTISSFTVCFQGLV